MGREVDLIRDSLYSTYTRDAVLKWNRQSQFDERWGRQVDDSIGTAELVKNSGFHSSIYKDLDIPRDMIAFRGTEFTNGNQELKIDVIANIINAFFGSSIQYGEAREVALQADLFLMHPTDKILFTGHSLGGGLASEAAVTLGPLDAEAVTFNSAGIELEPGQSDTEVTAIYSDTDPLSWIQDRPRIQSVLAVSVEAVNIPVPDAVGLRIGLPFAGFHPIFPVCMALSNNDVALCDVSN